MLNLGERYQTPFMIALGLHLLLGLMFAWEPSSSARPVLVNEAKNEAGNEEGAEQQLAKKPEIVKAVTVDEATVKAQIEQIKEARMQAAQQEQAKQQALKQAAIAARQARLNEQKRLQALKAEAEKIAIAKQKALEEEQKRLKQLQAQKAQEEKALAALKIQKETLKLQQEKQLQKEQASAKAKVESLKTQQAAAASAAAEKAAIDAAKRARFAGVVDKYKAQILQAISRQWILPEHLTPGLSSQFRIRLAPNGAVLEVSLMRSSGDPILDRSAQTAIYKASPLPVPLEPDLFDLFRDISLTVRPENVRV